MSSIRALLNVSDYITILAAWLRLTGVTVELYAHDLPHYGGLCRSKTREVFLNMPGAEDVLMTLAHEAGHHVGYVYGWKVLRLIGADKFMWTDQCAEDHRMFLKEQCVAQDEPRKRFRCVWRA